ncbi:MAG: HD domain-containing protein [Candidatus Aramenus sp.]|jgi:HD superfamily phosphohydrolase|nr:HD domain-containing protein [Candidatus Aramenus sp.]
MKLIRDPVHGYIEVPDKFLQVISAPVFQRLRYVKQTGLAYMVYPGMNHTRFEHSLGVMYLAREFAKFIADNSKLDFVDEDYVELVALAGLLHDVGHMPFSHTFENALILAKHVYGMDVEEYGKKTHVRVGEMVVRNFLSHVIDKEFSKNMSDPVDFVVRVLEEKPRTEEEKFANLVVSNFVDADRGDYLLRDSYYAGVTYGYFDVERLKRFLVYVDGKVAVISKAVPIVEQFLLARMYMFENVYFHSVVGLYNAIVSHAIVNLMEKGLRVPEDEKEFSVFTDDIVLSRLSDVDERLRNAVLFRKGFKRVKKDVTGKCLDLFSSRREEIYEKMREYKGLLIYHEFNDVPYYEEKDEALYVYDGGEVKKLTAISLIAKSLKEIRKAVIGYHETVEDKARELVQLLEECKTLGP